MSIYGSQTKGDLVLNVLKYPDSILRKKAMPVEVISKEIFELVDNMIETMLNEDGLGLAANQIGSLMRIFVLNTTPMEETPKPVAVINPEILDKDGTIIDEEGCLSFPGLYLKVARAGHVRMRAKNLYNEDIIYETNGVLARAIQHEMDHLNGILFIDHVDKAEENVKKYLDNLTSSTEDE